MEFANDKNWQRNIKKILLNKLLVVKISGYIYICEHKSKVQAKKYDKF